MLLSKSNLFQTRGLLEAQPALRASCVCLTVTFVLVPGVERLHVIRCLASFVKPVKACVDCTVVEASMGAHVPHWLSSLFVNPRPRNGAVCSYAGTYRFNWWSSISSSTVFHTACGSDSPMRTSSPRTFGMMDVKVRRSWMRRWCSMTALNLIPTGCVRHDQLI